ILGSPAVFTGGDSSSNVTFNPLTTGTTTIGIVTPIGFSTPTTDQQRTATVSAPNTSIGNATVGRDLQTTVSISLATAPPSPVTVTVTSNDSNIATITTNGTAVGGTTVTFTNVASMTVGTIFVQGRSLGSTTITVRAPGYNDGTGTVVVQPSGFYLVSTDFTTTAFAANTAVSVGVGRLDPITLNVVQGQAVRGGLGPINVPVVSSNSAIGAIENSPASFSGGDTTKSVSFNPATAGTATLSLPPPAPAGFTTPSSAQAIVATVESDINIGDVTIGKDLQVLLGGTVGTAPAGNLQVTITSLDPSKVLLATSATAAGAASINVMVGAGSGSIPSVYVQALAGAGTAVIQATAPGYTTDTSTITLQPSGFYFQSASFSTTSFSLNTTLAVGVARLDPLTLNVAQNQALRGGLSPFSVVITNSNTTAGAIVGTPLSFTGNDLSETFQFDPANAGAATIGIVTPAGFTVPSNNQQITATVTAPAINFTGPTIGKDLQVSSGATLGAPAPAGNVLVTITSLDPSKVLLSTSTTAAGVASLPPLLVGAGTTSIPTFFIQALTSTGTAQIQLSAPGYTTATGTITFQPSGFYLQTANFSTTSFSTNTTISVASARLDPLTLNTAQNQPIRGGFAPAVDVSIGSSDPTVGTIIGSPISFGANDASKSAAFDPLNAGTSTISLTTPAGFSTPSNAQQITATVTAPAITIGNATVGKDLQVTANVSLGVAPPAPVNVTVTSSDGNIASVTDTATVAGSNTVTFMNVTTASVNVIVQGRGIGSATITAHATGYVDGSSTATVDPSGFYLQTSAISTTTFSTNSSFGVGLARLNPQTLAFAQSQPLRGGLSNVNVTVSSSNTTVGTIVGSPVTFNATDLSKSLAFDPANAGTSTVSVSAPAGFSTPSTNQQLTATVTAPNTTIGNPTVGKDLQTTTGVSLAVAPPGPVDVTVTVANSNIATISTDGHVEGGATLLFQNVTTTSVGTIFVQGRGLGSTTITVHAAGYNDAVGTVTVDPSGFYLQTSSFTTTTFSGNTSVLVSPARLNPQTLNVAQNQAVRGGLSGISVTVNNSNSVVGTLTGSPATFNATDLSQTLTFNPDTAGTSTISVSPVAGFSTPSSNQQITATVTAPTISIGNPGLGKDLQTTTGISLAVTPPSPVDVTVTVTDGTIAKIATSATVDGVNSLLFQNVTTTSVGTIFVQGFTVGTTTITVHAAGYQDATGTVTVDPSGFYLQTSSFTTTAGANNTNVAVGAARLNSVTLNVAQNQALRGGLSGINVTVNSSNPAVGTIVGSPVSFDGNNLSKTVAFDPSAAGTSTITITTPAGFSTPSNSQQITATVNP
ncbi:MAG TPA: hypothetical protein VF456_11715, partial [Vicinamibacterales bacterium]